MAGTQNVTIRIDSGLKKEAESLFTDLGMSLSTAFHLFLRQSLRVQGLPFEVRRDTPSPETLAAMREAEKIARDPAAPGFRSSKELFRELDS